MAAGSILSAERLIKRFPGVIALKGVSFDLRPGEVHALCGENGAGKSTLIKTLCGVHPAGSYEGEIRVDGKVASFAGPKDAEKAGIAVIYQELALVPEMTVAENVFLGSEPRRLGGLLIDWDKIYRDSKNILDQFGLDIDPGAKVADLGIGHRQLVEIAKALSKHTRVLILDEPTAALTEKEVDVLLNIIRDLRSRGIGLIYISHKLDEVFAVADRITVLRDGQSIVTLDAANVSGINSGAAALPVKKSEIIKHMVGREITELFPRRATTAGDAKLVVKNLSVISNGRQILFDISFEARAGQVLGVGGLMGAGRSEMLMHLFGVFGKRMSGDVMVDGRPLPAGNTPAQSIERGLVLVSEDRKRFGLVLDQTIGFNLSLSSIRKMTHGGWIDTDRENCLDGQMFTSLRIKAAGLSTVVGTLSGGNQQKVVLGKALMTAPGVIFLDEPTRGIDVGAKIEVYELINRLTDAGQAVVLVSSELPELMGMSDRILMLSGGRVGGIFLKAEATQEKLLAAAMAPDVSESRASA